MKQGLSWIAMITDRSGSMQDITDAAISGFNEFINTQRTVPGEAKVTLILFDNEYLVPYRHKDLPEVPELNTDTFVPRNSTALLDAIGRTINDYGRELEALPEDERPENVIIAILTDGYENASNMFNQTMIASMIKHQQEVYNWNFVFLAANIDTAAVAAAYNIQAKDAYSFESNAIGTQTAYSTMSEAVTRFRTGN